MPRRAAIVVLGALLALCLPGASAAAPSRVLGGDVFTLTEPRGSGEDAKPARFPLRQISGERHLAELGLVGAQYNLGVMYATNGRYEAAQHWYRKAALRGHREASYNLGLLLLVGQGGPRDEIRAVRWIDNAATRGLPEAHYLLGRLNYEGRGVARDPARELEHYLKAAEARYPLAQHDLAVLYHLGEGVARDDVEAFAWFSTADAGGFDSRDALAVIGATLSPEQRAAAAERAADLMARFARRELPGSGGAAVHSRGPTETRTSDDATRS